MVLIVVVVVIIIIKVRLIIILILIMVVVVIVVILVGVIIVMPLAPAIQKLKSRQPCFRNCNLKKLECADYNSEFDRCPARRNLLNVGTSFFNLN